MHQGAIAHAYTLTHAHMHMHTHVLRSWPPPSERSDSPHTPAAPTVRATGRGDAAPTRLPPILHAPRSFLFTDTEAGSNGREVISSRLQAGGTRWAADVTSVVQATPTEPSTVPSLPGKDHLTGGVVTDSRAREQSSPDRVQGCPCSVRLR